MRVIFKTNLDIHRAEEWPEVDFIPPIGTQIHSKKVWKTYQHLVLEVCGYSVEHDNRIVVELHIPKFYASYYSLRDWYQKVYQPMCGSTFI